MIGLRIRSSLLLDDHGYPNTNYLIRTRLLTVPLASSPGWLVTVTNRFGTSTTADNAPQLLDTRTPSNDVDDHESDRQYDHTQDHWVNDDTRHRTTSRSIPPDSDRICSFDI
jgi:hypothetical protein